MSGCSLGFFFSNSQHAVKAQVSSQRPTTHPKHLSPSLPSLTTHTPPHCNTTVKSAIISYDELSLFLVLQATITAVFLFSFLNHERASQHLNLATSFFFFTRFVQPANFTPTSPRTPFTTASAPNFPIPQYSPTNNPLTPSYSHTNSLHRPPNSVPITNLPTNHTVSLGVSRPCPRRHTTQPTTSRVCPVKQALNGLLLD